MTKNLRDEIAMSMSLESIPKLQDTDEITKVAEFLSIKIDFSDEISMINFALEYESFIRYEYADAMIKRRGEKSGPWASASDVIN